MQARVALLASVVAIGACRSESGIPTENASITVNVASPAAPKVTETPPVLDRRDLLLAAIEARSAAATGADDREAQRALERRRFSFRVRLGCTIVAPAEGGGAEAIYDPDKRRVSLSVAGDVSLDNPFVAALAGEGVEAAEGFWVRSAWLLAPACAGAPSGQPEIGLVQFFKAEEPRTERRGGRPYEAGAALPEGVEAPVPGRWDLVLQGRLVQHRDGRVIACRAPLEGGIPVCLISVRFDAVAIEDVESGEELARWARG